MLIALIIVYWPLTVLLNPTKTSRYLMLPNVCPAALSVTSMAKTTATSKPALKTGHQGLGFRV